VSLLKFLEAGPLQGSVIVSADTTSKPKKTAPASILAKGRYQSGGQNPVESQFASVQRSKVASKHDHN
jgi:hypothetical protein